MIYIIDYFLISYLIFCIIWMVEDIHILIREYNFKSIRWDISPIYSSLNINTFASPSHSVIVCSKAYFNNILIVVNVHDWFIIIGRQQVHVFTQTKVYTANSICQWINNVCNRGSCFAEVGLSITTWLVITIDIIIFNEGTVQML